MNARAVFIGIILVVLAVIAQTTLFSRLDEVGFVADIVLVVVVVAARFLHPEPALLLGFTGGIVYDLVRTTPIGLRAMVFTLVAYGAVRFFGTSEGTHLSGAAAVSVLSLVGVGLFAVIGTLFGQEVFEGINYVQTFVLLPVFNGLLSLMVGPIVKRLMVPRAPVGSLL